MGADEIIQVIKEEDLLQFFFEFEEEYLTPDYGFETGEGEELWHEDDIKKYLTRLGLQNYQDKGGRADTSEFWNVVYFPDYDVYLKISGWYDSYGNYEHEYSEIKEVRPQEVTKTIYT